MDDHLREIKLSRKSFRIVESGKPRGITEVLHINFDDTFIHLVLDRSLSTNRIVWKDPRTKGIDQNKLYNGCSSSDIKRSIISLAGLHILWKSKSLPDSVWMLEFRSGVYVLCEAICKEITKAVSKSSGKNGEHLVHQWDKESGLEGAASCLHRLSFMPGPCDIGESSSIVIFSNFSLLRSLTDTVGHITSLPKYITRLIVEFAFLGDWAPNPVSLEDRNGIC